MVFATAALTTALALFAPLAMASEPVPVRQVVVDRLDVRAEPDVNGFVTSRIFRGDKVEVRKTLADGWLAISAPSDSFLWIDDTAVDVARNGQIVVTAARTTLRLGREGEELPGPPQTTLNRGAIREPVRQPLLTYGEGRRRRVWRAVAPERDAIRFIRAESVIDPSLGEHPVKDIPRAERRVSLDATRPGDFPADLIAPLERIEGAHRSIVAQPMEGWSFATVRQGYQALLASRPEPSAASALKERLDEIDRQEELAQSARQFETIVKSSRRRDGRVEQIKAMVRDLHETESLAFDAQGLLQATARRVEGEKVFSLLDDEGRIVTYLKLPPGIETTSLLARQVGVRGKSRFNDDLRFRLLDVRDIEPLDAGR